MPAGIHGIHRQREWEAVATVETELPGDRVTFAALADGTLIVDEEVPDDALVPVAEAIEGSLAAPYRAVGRPPGRPDLGRRREPDRRPSLPRPGGDGDELELVEDDHVILGRRLDGDLFEIEVTPL